MLTANDIHKHHAHPQIVYPHPPIHAPRHDLMPHHMQTADAVSCLLQHLYWLGTLALAIPQPDGSVVTPADDHTAVFPAKAYTVHAAEMPAPAFQRSSGRYVPEKDLLVAADAGEPGIVVGNG